MIVKHYDFEVDDPDYSPVPGGQGSLYQLAEREEEDDTVERNPIGFIWSKENEKI